jgi:hypothetical protein
MFPGRWSRAAALAALCSLIVTSCGSVGSSDSPDGAAATAAAQTAGAETSVAVASDDLAEIYQIVAPAVGGGEVDFAQFAGQPLAVWFWAPG